MQRFARSSRVSGLVGRELSVIIDRELRDERIGMVTVTGVDMSRDLKNARVYVSVLGDDEETNRSLDALNAAAPYIRARLGERVVLRYLPNLQFFFDSSTVDGMRMDRILDEIRQDDSKRM